MPNLFRDTKLRVSTLSILIIPIVAMVVLTPFHGLKAATETTSYGITLDDALNYPANFTHFDYVNPEAPKGGTVRLAATGTYDSLNPFLVRGISASGVGYLFDTLLASADDQASTAYGLLAESITRPADNRWVSYRLRNEARFHDGSPVTAEDVVFTFNFLMEHGHPHYRAYYAEVEKAEALSKQEVRFTFKTNTNRELALILGQFPIISKAHHSQTEHDASEPGMTPLMGSGPYMLDTAEPGKYIRYKRNPDYWGKDLPVNKGRYNFDQVQIDYYRDETVVVQALLSGEYDFREENIARNWATAYDVPAIEEGTIKKELIDHDIPSGMQGMFFNTRRSKFADRRVRKAIAWAFDFEWANENLFHNSYKRSLSYFTNSDLAATGLPSDEELTLLSSQKDSLPQSLFAEPFTLPVNQSPRDVRKHLMQAKTLLEEAGWHVKDRRLTHAESGEVMEIEFLLAMPSFERVIAPYIKNLEKLGIQASIRIVDAAQYQKRLETFDFDMITFVYGQSMHPGNEQINYWHSSKADVEGSRNLAGINNPAIDAIIPRIIDAKNRDELRTAAHALDRILLHEFYCVPSWHLGAFRILYWDKFGRPETMPKYDLGFPDTWWFDKEKAEKLSR